MKQRKFPAELFVTIDEPDADSICYLASTDRSDAVDPNAVTRVGVYVLVAVQTLEKVLRVRTTKAVGKKPRK